ncbi:MAG TPA: hypothetical protein DDX33_01555 [Rikenellaceae bacterium]|nr:hypothetical protein [Rikenellaceae bacterium]
MKYQSGLLFFVCGRYAVQNKAVFRERQIVPFFARNSIMKGIDLDESRTDHGFVTSPPLDISRARTWRVT